MREAKRKEHNSSYMIGERKNSPTYCVAYIGAQWYDFSLCEQNPAPKRAHTY